MMLVLEGEVGLGGGQGWELQWWWFVEGEGRAGGLGRTKRSTAGVHDQSHDETVQPEHFSENEDQNHAHKQPGLLRRTTHAGIPHDSNGKASCQSAQPYTQSSSQVQERRK